MTQLVLDLDRPPRYRTADLVPNAAQDEARTWLARTPAWPLGRLVLWGAPGTGKTHLLHAWAETNHAAILPEAPPEGWPARPIAIDTIDTVPDEIALLHLLNAAAEARHPVLLAATSAPSRLPVRLPDLASRLRATTAVEIGPAPDSFLRQLLARLLAERQLRLPPSLQRLMLLHLPRTPDALRDAVTRLDSQALRDGRPINRALVTEVLRLHDNSNAARRPTSPAPPRFAKE